MSSEGIIDAESKKTLSQWEIDLLLGTISAQEGQESVAKQAPPSNIRPYDFRRPDKFSKEHLRALQTIHENFARITASALSSLLRTGVQIKLSSVEQAVYGEYMQQLASPTVINLVSADPLPGHLILEVNFGLAFALLDRLLGGRGESIPKSREVTDIELALLQTLARTLIAALRDAWSNMASVRMNLDDLVFSPEVVQAALPGDIGVLLLYELHINELTNTISMFVPYTMLEPVIARLGLQMWFTSGHKSTPTSSEDIRRQLAKVELPVVVDLGATTVTIRELLGLQEGNVIKLDTTTRQELQVRIGGRPKFKSRPGRVGRRLAVKITRVLGEEVPVTGQTQEANLTEARR